MISMNYQLHIAGVFWPEYTYEPCYAPPRKIPFINEVQPFYGCQQMRVKKLQLLTVTEIFLRAFVDTHKKVVPH